MKIKSIIASGIVLITAGTLCYAAQQGPDKAPRAKAPTAGRQGGSNVEWWGPGPGRVNQKPVAQGVVVGVDADKLEIETPKNGAMAFQINAQTKVKVAGKDAKITDIKKDDKVVVRFQPQEGSAAIALSVAIPQANEARKGLRGKITAIEGSVIVIGDKRITVNAETKIRSGRYIGSISDLKVGYQITVAGDPAAAKGINFTPAVAKGTVTEINGDTFTVKTVKKGTIQVKAGAGTAYTVRPRVGDNTPGTIAEVKVGSPVNVGYHADSKALLWIDILTGM